jgi:uncharacterized membrane protein
MNAQRIDDKPQERESPVRHAHAVQASRHGRASAPGYLGLPADQEPEDADIASDQDDADQDDAEQETDRKQRRGGRARAREATTGESGDGRRRGGNGGDDKKSDKAGSRAQRTQQAKKPSGSSKTAARSSGQTKARTAKRSGTGGGKAASTGSKESPSKRNKSQGARKPASKRAPGGSAKAAAASVKSKVASVGDGAERAVHTSVRKEALRVGGSLLKRALIAGSRKAAQTLAHSGSQRRDSLLENVHRPPIQQSIDVAVPPEIAWQQWMELKHLPEGVQRLSGVERDGDRLSGRIAGPRGGDWSAEVIDEREQESFAWRSTEGTDSAGLATFHPLSERLTRIELTLDVRPEDLGEAARLMLHIADRRVEEELRRFKADAELLNPDVYAELLGEDGATNGQE